jgi:hypothetical protein
MNFIIGAVRQQVLNSNFVALRYSNGCRGLINLDNITHARMDSTLITVREKQDLHNVKQILYFLNCNSSDLAKMIYSMIDEKAKNKI